MSELEKKDEKIEDDVEFVKALFGHLGKSVDKECLESEIPEDVIVEKRLQELQDKVVTLAEQNAKLLDALHRMWDKLDERLKRLEK